MSALAAALREVGGSSHVVTDPDVTEGYSRDWTGRFVGRAPLVVRPGTSAEVAAVVASCSDLGVAVVPQGGNTGLVGGSVPLHGEVVLSLTRLDDLAPVEPLSGQVTVGAGVTLERLQAHVTAAGFAFGVDLGARSRATIGGMVATNAGGNHVVRYGPMRAQVLGVEAVLADGRVLTHLGGLVKDNTGYDLAGLLAGSEGTLAVLTRLRLRLVPRLEHRVTALLAVRSVTDALDATARLRSGVPSMEAAELFLDDGLRLVADTLDLAPPFGDRWPAYLLVECADVHDPTDLVAGAVESLGALVADAAVAVDAVRRAALWRYREAHAEAISSLGVPHKLDVALPPAELAAFADDVAALVADLAPSARCFLFGHVADGNLHVNVVGPELLDEEVDGAVFRLAAARGGTISAEHGIGTAKRRWLHLSRSPEEIEAFRAIKSALDPRGILNPNVLLPPAEVRDDRDGSAH